MILGEKCNSFVSASETSSKKGAAEEKAEAICLLAGANGSRG